MRFTGMDGKPEDASRRSAVAQAAAPPRDHGPLPAREAELRRRVNAGTYDSLETLGALARALHRCGAHRARRTNRAP